MIKEAVLTIRILDEELISIDTTELTITLRRHSMDKLVGLNIQGRDGRISFAGDKRASLSRPPGASFVDTQVD